MAQLIAMSDVQRPSFFEMWQQSTFMPALKPALKYALTIVSQRRPGWEWAVHYLDEIFAALQLLAERHFIQVYDASVSENFFALLRVPSPSPGVASGPGSHAATLTSASRRWAVLCLVLVPYLKGRLDALYESRYGSSSLLSVMRATAPATGRSAAGQSRSASARDMIDRAFQRLYPWMHAAFEGTHFGYQLLYLLEVTEHYSPFYHLLKHRCQRQSMEDVSALLKRSQAAREAAIALNEKRTLFLRWIGRGILQTWYGVIDYSHLVLLGSFCVFKVLEWWYSVEGKLPTQALPIPPPPDKARRAEGGLAMPTDPTQCPICRSERSNPAANHTGYVFCYPCIFTYVQQHQRCPVTHITSSQDQIRKLYETSS